MDLGGIFGGIFRGIRILRTLLSTSNDVQYRIVMLFKIYLYGCYKVVKPFFMLDFVGLG
jgi:hypothetical protein